MHPDRFIRLPRCGCGKERKAIKLAIKEGRKRPQTWWIDNHRDGGREHPKKNVCKCDNYSYPHRRGSGWCIHNPNWTAEDAERRQAYA